MVPKRVVFGNKMIQCIQQKFKFNFLFTSQRIYYPKRKIHQDDAQLQIIEWKNTSSFSSCYIINLLKLQPALHLQIGYVY